jgi:hypothetical protein
VDFSYKEIIKTHLKRHTNNLYIFFFFKQICISLEIKLYVFTSKIPAAPAYGVYISVDTIFQSLWFLSKFPSQRVAANNKATQPSVPIDYVEVITSKVLRSPP